MAGLLFGERGKVGGNVLRVRSEWIQFFLSRFVVVVVVVVAAAAVIVYHSRGQRQKKARESNSRKSESKERKKGGESGYHIGLGNRGNTKQGVIGRRPVEGTANEGGGREEVRSKNGILIFIYFIFIDDVGAWIPDRLARPGIEVSYLLQSRWKGHRHRYAHRRFSQSVVTKQS